MKHAPWFVPESIAYLESKIQQNWNCFEWGCGQSTLWLAEQSGSVISIEHDPAWAKRIGEAAAPYKNTQVFYQVLDKNYADFILKYPPEFDLIEVDGRNRSTCIQNAISKLKSGGILIVDNSERERYQEALALVKKWTHVDFYDSSKAEGWVTSIYSKP